MSKKATPLVTLAQARANKTPIDWADTVPPKPKFIGRRVFRNYDLAELARHRLGAVLPDLGPGLDLTLVPDDETVEQSARRVLSDGQDVAVPDRGPLAQRTA